MYVNDGWKNTYGRCFEHVQQILFRYLAYRPINFVVCIPSFLSPCVILILAGGATSIPMGIGSGVFVFVVIVILVAYLMKRYV